MEPHVVANEPAGDHASGLELQIVELVEQQDWTAAQGRWADHRRLQSELERLYAELAETADHSARFD